MQGSKPIKDYFYKIFYKKAASFERHAVQSEETKMMFVGILSRKILWCYA